MAGGASRPSFGRKVSRAGLFPPDGGGGSLREASAGSLRVGGAAVARADRGVSCGERPGRSGPRRATAGRRPRWPAGRSPRGARPRPPGPGRAGQQRRHRLPRGADPPSHGLRVGAGEPSRTGGRHARQAWRGRRLSSGRPGRGRAPPASAPRWAAPPGRRSRAPPLPITRPRRAGSPWTRLAVKSAMPCRRANARCANARCAGGRSPGRSRPAVPGGGPGGSRAAYRGPEDRRPEDMTKC